MSQGLSQGEIFVALDEPQAILIQYGSAQSNSSTSRDTLCGVLLLGGACSCQFNEMKAPCTNSLQTNET